MKKKRIERIFEIIPGFLSWSVIFLYLGAFLINPLIASLGVIIYLIYWVCRLLYMSFLLVMAHHRVVKRKNIDWLGLCADVDSDLKFDDIIHVVLYPTYKEPIEVLEDSLNALKESNYPKEKLIVVLAGEEREKDSHTKLQKLCAEFPGIFKDIFITIHPQNLPKEIPCKGANATYAARKIKDYLVMKGYALEKVIISCFDADTRPDKSYFACLSYRFLSHSNRYRTSFQPFPVYSNNIYKAPALSRIIEMGSTFWQLIESMRQEKFITFSSHSMSFKTLVEVGYWPVNLISDDSLIFWKCFLKYNGDYQTFPLEVPVYMDIAVGKNLLDTIRVQYKQKRRWAWGVENFAYLAMEFMKNKKISRIVKIRKLYNILDNHISWATWSIIISFITPLVLFWGKIILKNSLVLFNLSYINSIIFHSLSLIVIVCMFVNREFLPPRPKSVSRFIYVTFALQWLFIPLVSAFLGSFPALDAQSRLMFGRYLTFTPTLKRVSKNRDDN